MGAILFTSTFIVIHVVVVFFMLQPRTLGVEIGQGTSEIIAVTVWSITWEVGSSIWDFRFRISDLKDLMIRRTREKRTAEPDKSEPKNRRMSNNECRRVESLRSILL